MRAESFCRLMTQPVAYEEADAYRLTRAFLRGPAHMMERLFADEEP